VADTRADKESAEGEFSFWTILATAADYSKVAAETQEEFSVEYYPTVWQILPVYELFILSWSCLLLRDDMAILKLAIQAGLKSIKKYYNKADLAPVNIASICKRLCL
jgi:hypothetical protein